MGERQFKNITKTVVTIGLSAALFNNSSTIMNNGGELSVNSNYCFEASGFQTNNNIISYESKNIFIESYKTPLEKEAFNNFGVMRDATKEEVDSVEQYIKSISKPTGKSFFDLC